MIAQSRITAATVYNDRAEITRTTIQMLEKGEHALVFQMLPKSIEENSIQVKGSGNAVLKDVKFRPVYFDDFPDDMIKSLSDQQQNCADEIAELDDRIKHAQKEKGFVEDIAKRLTATTENSESFEMDPAKWIKMVEFYRTKQDELDREIRGAGREKKSIKNKLDRIMMELEAAGRSRQKEKKQLEVLVKMNEPGELVLSIIYIVYGPTWYPVYDLRISTDDKKMNIAYHAYIQQDTEEDWDDIELKLSTARPGISGQQPELSPWRVSIRRPEVPRLPAAASMASPDRAAMKQMFQADELPEEEVLMLKEDGTDYMEAPQTSVTTGATSVVFSVEGRNSVKSDNNQYRVTILMRDFPGYFRYSSVPKLAQYSYLKARVKNDTEYPFLPGTTNIFLDNNFVANAEMDLVSPSEEFWTSLGVDEGMKIEYKFLKKYEMTEGVFSKTTKLVYEYLIIVKNNKKSEEDLVIWDQLPVSGNEEIKVALIEPEYRKDSPALKIDDNSYIEWFFRPKPGEEIRVPFKFSVEYPRNISLTGLM